MLHLDSNLNTLKFLNIRTTRKSCCNYPKIRTEFFYYRVMGPKDADRMANSVDPYRTAPPGAD